LTTTTEETHLTDRPNIFLITTDDQAPHTIYSMGAPDEVVMDNLHRLFAGGVDLTDLGYTAQPLCGPARVAWLTGLYPHKTGADTNPISYDRYRASRATGRPDVIDRVAAEGYRVGVFGKQPNGYGIETDNGEWVHPAVDQWVALADRQGVDPYRVNTNGHTHQETANHTPYFGRAAREWIEAVAGGDEPWFCWLNWTDPHGPFTPLNRHEHAHDGARYTSPGVTEDDDGADKSRWTKARPSYGPKWHQERYEGALEELEGVDDWIGYLADTLSELGILENTIIVYTSDNGWMLGEHGGLTKKGLPYEESSRVPFLVRGPGIHDALRGRAVSHLDIPATIAHVASGQVPTDMDGLSMYEVTPETPWREDLLIEHPDWQWWMLRTDRYVYIEFDETGEVELYDLLLDPSENDDVSDDPAYTAERETLAARLAELRAS
jgi:N-acetylglucosamine-6-sulfatase